MIFTRKFDFSHWQYKLSVVFLEVIDPFHSFFGGKCVKNQFFHCLLVKILCHKIVWTVHNSVTPVFFLKAIIVFWYAPEVLFVYFSFLYTEYWHLLKGSDLLKLITLTVSSWPFWSEIVYLFNLVPLPWLTPRHQHFAHHCFCTVSANTA